MGRYSIGLLILGMLAFTACERPAPPAAESDSYNLTRFLQEQVATMQAKKPMVLKSVSTDNLPAETIQTDEVDWEDELAVFEQLDLNKPTLEEYYIKDRIPLEGGAYAVVYKKREDSEPLVHYLYLGFGPDKQLKQLQAILQDKNPLFFSRRKVMLQTDPGTGNISDYRIEGVQKLIFSDSLHFRVDANL